MDLAFDSVDTNYGRALIARDSQGRSHLVRTDLAPDQIVLAAQALNHAGIRFDASARYVTLGQPLLPPR